jgi:hypothetical protein
MWSSLQQLADEGKSNSFPTFSGVTTSSVDELGGGRRDHRTSHRRAKREK